MNFHKMSYKSAILKYAPDNWRTLDGEVTDLLKESDEYRQMAFEIRYALTSLNRPITCIKRIQNLHDLGQLLIREQLLLASRPYNNYFRVRRFIKLKRQYLDNALRYNLDHRRCGLAELVFSSIIQAAKFVADDIILVVQVVTSNPNETEVRPSNNLEYFIDYVVFF